LVDLEYDIDPVWWAPAFADENLHE